MESTRAASETSAPNLRPRHRVLGEVAFGAVLAGVALFGAVLQTAGAAETAPKTHRAAQITAIDGLVLQRLNAIRQSFGLVPGAATTGYDVEVSQALAFNEDPPFAPTADGVVGEEGLWGMIPGASNAGAAGALSIVNGWVYHDGWQGSAAATWNADCTSAAAPGCDGHRRNVLSTPPVAGSKLYIDVMAQSVTFDGQPALAVAALFVWKTGTVAP